MLRTLEPQQQSGTEQKPRRSTTAALFGGLAVIVWLAPLALHPHISEVMFRVATGLTASISVCAVLAGMELRVRSRLASVRDDLDARDRRQHDELRQLVLDGHTAIRQQLDETVTQLGQRMDALGIRTTQEYFNSYADAVADVAGGPSVVDGTSTRRLPDVPGERTRDKVIPLPRHRSIRTSNR